MANNECQCCGEKYPEAKLHYGLCDECFELEFPEPAEYENGPTGHGDICMSDADPGL